MQELHAFFGELKAPSRTNEELRAEFVFEFGDAPREGRLREKNAFGRGRKVERACGFDEAAQGDEIHGGGC